MVYTKRCKLRTRRQVEQPGANHTKLTVWCWNDCRNFSEETGNSFSIIPLQHNRNIQNRLSFNSPINCIRNTHRYYFDYLRAHRMLICTVGNIFKCYFSTNFFLYPLDKDINMQNISMSPNFDTCFEFSSVDIYYNVIHSPCL